MNKVLYIILISLFCLTVISSCSTSDDLIDDSSDTVSSSEASSSDDSSSYSSGWQLIARQVDSDNFTDGTHELFSSNASTTYLQNENGNSSSTFMSIGNLTPSNYVTDGKYKFKLEWDGLTVASLDNKSVTWTQTSWLDNSTIAGFQEIGHQATLIILQKDLMGF